MVKEPDSLDLATEFDSLGKLMELNSAKGLLRELDQGPLAPEARSMPLDQAADESNLSRHLHIESEYRTRATQDGSMHAVPLRWGTVLVWPNSEPHFSSAARTNDTIAGLPYALPQHLFHASYNVDRYSGPLNRGGPTCPNYNFGTLDVFLSRRNLNVAKMIQAGFELSLGSKSRSLIHQGTWQRKKYMRFRVCFRGCVFGDAQTCLSVRTNVVRQIQCNTCYGSLLRVAPPVTISCCAIVFRLIVIEL